jgi:hypothetical protein
VARRGVHLYVLVDASLEVAVPGEYGHDREVAFVDDLRDLVRERPAVADAGRTAVTDEMKAERLEVLGQTGAIEVLRDYFGAGCERGLDPRLGLQPLLHGVAGEDPGADQSVVGCSES